MRFFFLVALLFCPAILADDDWGALRYLIGNWTGEGGGAPGQGSGTFSFTPDLHAKVLVRKNHADYPATQDRQAYSHDDLMVIYRDADDSGDTAIKADYFDTEGHIIRYRLSMFGDRVVFTSEPARGTPQYRFTYTRAAADQVKIKFEVAAPGKNFTTYIEASARKTK